MPATFQSNTQVLSGLSDKYRGLGNSLLSPLHTQPDASCTSTVCLSRYPELLQCRKHFGGRNPLNPCSSRDRYKVIKLLPLLPLPWHIPGNSLVDFAPAIQSRTYSPICSSTFCKLRLLVLPFLFPVYICYSTFYRLFCAPCLHKLSNMLFPRTPPQLSHQAIRGVLDFYLQRGMFYLGF